MSDSRERSAASPDEARPDRPRGLLARYNAVPLYIRIVVGLVLGLIVGLLIGPRAGSLDLPARLILRVLGALAPPLILVAVVQALMTAQIGGTMALRLAGL